MHWDMYGKTQSDATDKVKVFMQQMIPHHQNAVNMAKVILRQATQTELKNAGQEMGGTDSEPSATPGPDNHNHDMTRDGPPQPVRHTPA